MAQDVVMEGPPCSYFKNFPQKTQWKMQLSKYIQVFYPWKTCALGATYPAAVRNKSYNTSPKQVGKTSRNSNYSIPQYVGLTWMY